MVAQLSDVKIYTVNGAAAGSSSSLPDWLTRKRAAKAGRKKGGSREHVEGTIELIQGFEFPEASNKIKTTRDGHHVIATGTYKPQMRVWDLDELTLKFERHSDAENVDFIILSDDWTKTLHLQNDRTIELHTQGGLHYRTRIPRFGRSLAYHYPSCDTFVSASGNEIYRLNLEQGRFLNPLILEDDEGGDIMGVNCVDVNPAHNLLAFGMDGNSSVQFWDPRSRSSVGILRLPRSRLLPSTASAVPSLPGLDDSTSNTGSISVTTIASRTDGLSYAVGTSTGHTLLYDIRSPKPFALKDQGYGLPVRNISWIEGGSRMAGDGMILSADKKVVKIWDRDTPSANFASITPANDLNHIHHIPGSGLFMTANEGIQMATYYIPQLGPAPRWASFLENITEEMEDQTVRNAYEDFKFVERNELRILGLDHLIGTPALKPYMHGYFVSLKLYDTARVIANPFAYAEHREKVVREKMDKMAETRIRAKKDIGVKVNRALAEKVEKEAERERKREEKRKSRKARNEVEGGDEHPAMEVDEEKSAEQETGDKPTLLNDARFKDLFENPEFAVDETTREYALLNPSAVARKKNMTDDSKGRSKTGSKTAVEEEDEESDKLSSDGLGGSSSDSDEDHSDDSSDAGELNKYDPRVRPGQKNERLDQAYSRKREQNRTARVNFVPLSAQSDTSGQRGDKNATFGQRRVSGPNVKGKSAMRSGTDLASFGAEGGMETSWVPSSTKGDEDSIFDNSGGQSSRSGKNAKRKGVEVFGAGMEKGGEDYGRELSESEKKGRTQRRKGMRSGSKNVFRKSGG
ncbi:hypothetical protein SERLA73DRAFT_117248 [Serpula lacrymans var. lacrymans S7.3]|uniref:Uncharacterized protein n=1 Tax=Serpula lacrymans var. lacrymans (strain S7.3) TaxID=936435 RepID=F8QGT2_SERL3|nr:hypothetical protein SERLA73DRAFT_117248 [Serpula lacrymans var. lacrymans S7.3]